ncbi:MAG: hypothetical protein WCP21_23500, partial [Armatimonadota bacterium]
IKIDGTTNDIIGWLTSAHQLNRFPYQIGGGNALFVHPGTPIIRKEPAAGAVFASDQVVRATLSNRGCTILFSHPVNNFVLPTITATTNSDVDGYTTGVQPGTCTIDWANSTYSLVMDPYEARRWTIVNPGGTGWKYDFVSGAPATTAYSSFVAWNGQPWTLAYTGFTNLAAYANAQMRGCPQLTNTVVTAGDMRISLYDGSHQSYMTGANTSTDFPSRPFARLKTEEYYIESYVPGLTYQIKHMQNEWGYDDDISGTTVPGGTTYRSDRVYPFDHEAGDPWNGGYWAIGGAVRQGSAGAYSGDVNNVMIDNGISLTGYDKRIYVAADGGASSAGGTDSSNLSGFQPSSGLNNFNESGVGVSFHELAHTFGAADLYDNDLYANHAVPPPVPTYHECEAMGPYSLMDAGGRLDAYHQIGMGYCTPQVITQDTLGVQIPEIEGLLRDPVILKIPANPYYLKKSVPHTSWQEYFLVENRNVNSSDGNGAYGFDSSTKGLYIYHIDLRNTARNNPKQAGFQRDDDL